MKKVLKRVIATVILTVMLCNFGFASGTVTGSLMGTGAYSYIKYVDDVDGNLTGFFDNDTHHGAVSSVGFALVGTTSVTVQYAGMSNASATLYIYREGYTTPYTSVNLVKYVNGMGTINTSVSLPAGQFYVKVVSGSNNTYSSGTVYIKYVAGMYYH